jgi:hypothetical protein
MVWCVKPRDNFTLPYLTHLVAKLRKHVASYTYTHSYIFMVWCLIKYSDFTFLPFKEHSIMCQNQSFKQINKRQKYLTFSDISYTFVTAWIGNLYNNLHPSSCKSDTNVTMVGTPAPAGVGLALVGHTFVIHLR